MPFSCVAVAEAGVSPVSRIEFTANQERLGAALDKLLEPLGLDYRCAEANRVEITPAQQVAKDLEVEFYLVKPLLAESKADELAVRIRQQVAPQAWREVGGPAVIALDAPSSYLIVLAPQRGQVELERWLGQAK